MNTVSRFEYIPADMVSDSITAAAKIASDNAISFYHGDEPGRVPGLLDQPHYWWQAGGFFGLLIQRWSIFGDTSHNDMITEAIQFQVGANEDFEPANQTSSLVSTSARLSASARQPLTTPGQ